MTPLGWLGRKTSTQTNHLISCQTPFFYCLSILCIYKWKKKRIGDVAWQMCAQIQCWACRHLSSYTPPPPPSPPYEVLGGVSGVGGGEYAVFTLSVILWFRLHSLENELIELDQILQMHCCLAVLGWDCYASVFANIPHSYGPWLLSKSHFCSISCEQIHGIWSNFAYALTLTRSRMRLLCLELCPLMIFRISFLLTIFRMN